MQSALETVMQIQERLHNVAAHFKTFLAQPLPTVIPFGLVSLCTMTNKSFAALCSRSYPFQAPGNAVIC